MKNFSSGEHLFLHVDLDAFFASVEQIKNPKMKGKPVVVGGRSSKRGVAVAASYEAKRCGVTTGMPWMQAKQKCPNAIFLPADFSAYADYSRRVQNILEKMVPVVAQASIDEAYLDLIDCNHLYKTPRQAAEKIYGAIKKETGLNVSIGIASSQSVAKMASKLAKPCGMMEVPKGAEVFFLSPLPVETMPGIGPQIGNRLRRMGIFTLGQLAEMSPQILRASFGVYGPYLRAKARGEDTWKLEVTEVVKSLGKEKTLEKNTKDESLLEKELLVLTAEVGHGLRAQNLYARSVAVKVRYADFTSESASKQFADATCFDRILFEVARNLLKPLIEGKQFIRLIGISAQNLVTKTPQMDLFNSQTNERWERFYKSVDCVRQLTCCRKK